MRVSIALRGLLGLGFCSSVHGYDPTDTIMDADSAQSGYLPNHNMDPAIVGGGSFGQIWQFNLPPNPYGQLEQFYAKPLVYTPSTTGEQVVLVFSEQNRIFSLNAVNGTLVASRDLSVDGEVPFNVADLGSCNDISGTIGITGTPVIDPTTDTIYFWAKSYLAPGLSGYQNGAFYFHAIDAATLKERPGFPVNIQGETADNDHTRYFTGGTVNQRASLNLVNGVIFAGFGGHCDQYNYTGWIVGMSTEGKYLTGYSTSAGPNAYPQDGTWNGGGGGCGVWMAGMPIVSDNSGRIFFSTGNAYKVENNGILPSSGHIHLDTLSEAIVNLAVNTTTGALTQQDYFETYQYQAMDAADRDLGSGGVILPDPATFSGGGVARLIVACGKNGNCYVTNADNLGGYKLGPGGGDAIIQTITPPSREPVFGNGGSYPLEGGYLYFTPIGSPTYVYALGFDSNGRPDFTLVSQTPDVVTGRAGVGPPTITTYKGQPGTAILWSLDPDAGVRAYNAVPVNGQNLTRIPLSSAPSVAKYQRVVFGDGRYYLTTTAGTVVGYGSPVALPLTCNDPLDFGSISIGSSKTLTVSCTANIAITSISISVPYMSVYQVTNSSLPRGSLSAGATFSFPITFNLSGSVAPGVQSTSINLNTVNGASGFSTQQPISVSGQSISVSPYASLIPLQVDFSPLIIGSAAAQQGSASTFVIQDIGQSNLTILGYAFTDNISDTVANTNVTVAASANGTSVLDKNGVFFTNDLPHVGTVIQSGASVTVDVVFNTSATGNFYSVFQIFTDGGMVYTTLVASADSSPIALLQQSTSEGGWITIPDCVIPVNGCTTQIDLGTSVGIGQLNSTISFTNMGGSDLEITKSKPPEGAVLGAENPNTDLSEGLLIPPGDSSTAAILFSPGTSVLNAAPIVYSGTWTLNTNDLAFGVHTLNFTATLAAPQVGPLINGQSQFQYLGCFLDNVNNRIESTQYNNALNSNGLCQKQALAAGMPFAGTEYTTECWVGPNIPSASLQVEDSLCATYLCPGDTTQICGGVGGYMYLFYDTTKYFPQNGTLLIDAPSSEPSVGPYKYLGCFTDSVASRALSGKIPGATSTNTLESCAAACSGYNYFGTEYSTECYCGNTLGSSASAAASSTCNMLCPGSSTEICGGSSRLSVYVLNSYNSSVVTSVPTSSTSTQSTSSSSTTISSTVSPPTAGAYVYVDCQTDLVAHRTLSSKSTAGNAMTVEFCSSFCAGYIFFGVEYSAECYCGNTLLAGSTAATDGRCDMACSGNAGEICGGPNGLSLYQLISSSSNSSSASIQSSTMGLSSSSTQATQLSQTSSSTQRSQTTQTSTQATPTPSIVISCPGSNGTIYTATNGDTFFLECYLDRTGHDLVMSYVSSYAKCAEACAYTPTCVAFSWVPPGPSAPCYMKNVIGTGNSDSAVWGARMVVLPSSNLQGSSSTILSTSLFNVSSSATISTSFLSSSSLSSSSVITTSSSSLSTLSTSLSSSISTSSQSSSSLSSVSSSSIPGISSSSTSILSPTSSSSSPSSSSFMSSTSSSFITTSSSSFSQSQSTQLSSSQTTSSTSSLTQTSTTAQASVSSSSSVTSTPTSSLFSTSSSISSTASSSATASVTSTTFTSTQSSSISSSTTLSGTVSSSASSLSSSSMQNSISSTLSTSVVSITLSSSSTTMNPTLLPSWNYIGCASDSTASRALNLASTTVSTMDITLCQSYCQSNNYPLAGAEYGTQCFCGFALASGHTLGQSGCTMACGGNSSQQCGGPSRLSVYNNTAYVMPVVVPSVGAYQMTACYSDSTTARAFNSYVWTSPNTMTVEACVNTCSSRNYQYAGVEYGGECYCGNTIASTSLPIELSTCQENFCNGNMTEYCGGSKALLVYSN